MPTVISIENVCKSYRLGVYGSGTLREDLQSWWHRMRGLPDPNRRVDQTHLPVEGHTLWALQDVSLAVEQGEVLGIIGRNGAGKSTLLKILSRVTAPTSGRIRVKGRVASLLEVGTGFHPELTGRENIFLNGAILGMTKAEVVRKFDEIVAFSEIEDFIDTPVKRYSSGMYVRLAFAVAAHLDPEILVVDEVLAVGDAAFQKKCVGKMGAVAKGGRTVLFVSHNMGSVRNLCRTGVVLNRGRLNYVGTANDAVDRYLQHDLRDDVKQCRNVDDHDRDVSKSLDVKFISAQMADDESVFASNQPIDFILRIKGNRNVNGFRLNATISTMDENPVGSVSSNTFFSIKAGEEKTLRLSLQDHHLALGSYLASFSLGTGNYATKQFDYDVICNVLKFRIDYFDRNDKTAFSEWNKGWGSIAFIAKVYELSI